MERFRGKKILFFSAVFFNYEKEIVKKMQFLGATVDFYNERPSNSTFAKGTIRVNKNLYQRKIKTYYQSILRASSGKDYDFMLVIKGETVPEFFLKQFKDDHPETKMIYYGYDPLSEYPRIKNILSYFDKKLTFDRQDAVHFKMQFRPLFYIDVYDNRQNLSFKYDLSFIGSAHTDRFLIGEMLENLARKIHLKTYFYYFAPSRSVLLLRKIFDKHFEKIKLEKVSYQHLTHPEILKIYHHSRAILDIQKPFQNGLTMRTFEVLASGRKLVTTNADIALYPFYNEQNVMIITRENPVLNKDFFETPFIPVPHHVLYKMGLQSWLEDVFFNEEKYF